MMYIHSYIKTKIIMHGDKCHYNFCRLNVSKDGVEYK